RSTLSASRTPTCGWTESADGFLARIASAAARGSHRTHAFFLGTSDPSMVVYVPFFGNSRRRNPAGNSLEHDVSICRLFQHTRSLPNTWIDKRRCIGGTFEQLAAQEPRSLVVWSIN